MIDSVAATKTAASGPEGIPENPKAVLGKDDFLKLLITQLKYQDPLNPLDQNQFLSQTAQFTSLEQLQNISKGLTELKTAATDSAMAQAASLIGKTVQVSGRDFAFKGGKTTLGFTLAGPAGGASVQILDREGNLLRQITTGSLKAGANTVEWDGKDSSGKALVGGSYFYKVIPAGAEDGIVPAAVAAQGVLTGFERQGSELLFRLGTSLVRQSDIIQVQ
jgi:flagellar basal-body rod modification protein FlgD